MNQRGVVVLDFGGQYAHLIARRCRELGVHSELFPPDTLAGELREKAAVVILSGGPGSVYEANAPRCDPAIFDLPTPILGICYGAQLIASMHGGTVKKVERREYGRAELHIDETDTLLRGMGGKTVWMSHGDQIESFLGSGAKILAHTKNAPVAAFRLQTKKNKRIYGVQFHPEVQHTEGGRDLLYRFLYEIGGCKPSLEKRSFVEGVIEGIQREVKGEKVICGLSGGVDSTTTAMLVHAAVGDNLTCIYVDNGLMRKGESEEVLKLGNRLRVMCVDARERFMRRLKGVTDPEEKRMIVGEEFIRVFEEEAQKIGSVGFLVQGTIYPDRIESAGSGSGAARIKSHHNVGALPKKMKLRIIEPLKDLYKDEVKEVAREIGVPDEIIRRHPFPGPGLAARIMGEVTPEKLRICREASFIVEEELKGSGWYDKVWQAFAIVGDDRATGVLGDRRKVGHVVIVKVVGSVEAMTADFVRLPYPLLDRISRRIVNEVDNVTWVAYAISSKPPSTIEPC